MSAGCAFHIPHKLLGMDQKTKSKLESPASGFEDALPLVVWTTKNAEASENVFASDSSRVLITDTTDNILWDKATGEFKVYLKSGSLSIPMGGVSFNMVPATKNDTETIVSLGIRYSAKFPNEFLWNLGGHQPGLFGTYVSSAGTSAAANDVFECRGRWDAKGRFGVNLRKNSEYDPNEWAIREQTKVPLSRDTWYDISFVADIDGSLEMTMNDVTVFSGTCHGGFEKLTGVRFCAYTMDTMGIDGSFLEIKNVEIRAKLHCG